VRLEAGLILLEVDYTSARHAMNPEQSYSPFEIGLGRLVSFDKADFVGRLALERERRAGGPARRLVGL
jgi:aminomethyltransferase